MSEFTDALGCLSREQIQKIVEYREAMDWRDGVKAICSARTICGQAAVRGWTRREIDAYNKTVDVVILQGLKNDPSALIVMASVATGVAVALEAAGSGLDKKHYAVLVEPMVATGVMPELSTMRTGAEAPAPAVVQSPTATKIAAPNSNPEFEFSF